MGYIFRDLKENEIDVRIAQVKSSGVSLLLYKDARVDQNILDETFTPYNWQRDHKELKGNIYCGISVFDHSKNSWVTKWDCGKESFTEAEKGEASDSFKRAGFNWGIGRELYTSPFIWIDSKDTNIKTDDKGRLVCSDRFYVEKIQIVDKEITALSIKNNRGKRVFVWQKEMIVEPITAQQLNTLQALIKGLGDNAKPFYDNILATYSIQDLKELNSNQYGQVLLEIKKMKGE